MILHVAERAHSAANVARVIVATDDQRIFDVVHRAGFEVRMTRADHRSGSDRLAEVAAELADEFQLIVNVQGDEPFISPRVIEQAIDALRDDPPAAVATTCELIDNAEDVLNPDLVKVVTNEQGRALYFSRSPVPYPRDAARRHGSLAAALKHEPELLSSFRKHTGLYVYRRHFLLDYARWPQSKLEQTEALEQLRILERGHQIRVVEVAESSVGIDTPEDLELARKMFGEVSGQRLEASEFDWPLTSDL